MNATERVSDILRRCGTSSSVMPATALYNEGWMLRLLLEWFSNHPDLDHPLGFLPRARWYSEGLLTSQFLPRTRGDTLAETWTHADAVLGHFQIAEGRAVQLDRDAEQFVVVEAKMFSPLSSGTKRAQTFDQAARNVACMAETIHRAQRSTASMERVGFVVLAPETQIGAGIFGRLCEKDSIAAKVEDRVLAYGTDKSDWHANVFLPLLERIHISLLSWESVLKTVEEEDPQAASSFGHFYAQCSSNGRLAVPR